MLHGIFSWSRPKWLCVLLGPPRTEIGYEELLLATTKASAKRENGTVLAGAEITETDFEQFEKLSSARFRAFTRWAGFTFGLMLSIAFQVNAVGVWDRLAEDAAWREQVNAVGEKLSQSEAVRTVAQYKPQYEELAEQALKQVTTKRPELAQALEEMSGQGESDEQGIQELRLVLRDHPERHQIAREFAEQLSLLRAKMLEETKETALGAKDELASLGIRFWPEGWQFFCQPSNWVGVLLSALLFSFGAPFWFDALKRVMNLRDVFADSRKQREKAGS
jgi:hypothetical protein